MRKIVLLLIIQLAGFDLFSQNVGIGTPTPSEKLDVNGNINLTGTIKANGTDGQPNQVLMKNSSGTLAWGDMSDYKNFATFLSTGSWLVPAGVTKIAVELWGPGGGGASVGGGGGGSYIVGVFTVTPGNTINISVGPGGAGATNSVSSGGDGTFSRVIIGGVEIDAYGGKGAVYNSAGSYYSSGDGGSYYASPGFTAFIGIYGQNGTVSKKNYAQAGTATFYEIGEMGNGGDAANTVNSGGKGIFYIATPGGFPAFTDIRFSGNNASKVPGGGGGSYLVNSFAGANGMAIIRF
ncbi:MAG: hypothetical protein IPP96_14690 [Chitinophagaceae bacterium]|nr:hypothetical protein [Chitinophagaceae bacterium]